jgi:hypothetical protein
MKKLLLALLAVFAFASCTPMTPVEYAASKAEQRAKYPELQKLYRDGQTSEEISAGIKAKHGHSSFGKQTAQRPPQGWYSPSWQSLEEEAGNHRVEKVDRYTFGGVTLFLAPAVYHHRIYYDKRGKSIGWYLTQD